MGFFLALIMLAAPVADGVDPAREPCQDSRGRVSLPDGGSELPEPSRSSDRDPDTFLPSWEELLSGRPAPGPGPEITLRLSPVFRWFTGHTIVRENGVQGSRLDLDRDLGLRTAVGANVQGEVEGESLDFLTEVEELFGSGGHASSQPFAWNGTVYSAPAQIRAHASLLTIRSTLASKAYADDEDWVGPLVGFEYPYYNLTVGTNRQKGSLEDWIHYLPYPVVGLAGQTTLTDSTRLGFRLIGGYLPNVPAPYTEGGRLYVSSRPSLSLAVPLTWSPGKAVDLSVAFTYQYWTGGDHSVEDGNKWVLSSPGVQVGVAVRW
jgi:hypothetical protein